MAERHGISDQTICTWRNRFGSFQPDDVRRLKQLEAENGRLPMTAVHVMNNDVIPAFAEGLPKTPIKKEIKIKPEKHTEQIAA